MLNWNQKIPLFAFKGISNKLVIKVVGMDSNVAHCMNGHKFDFQRLLRIVSDFFSLDFYFVSSSVNRQWEKYADCQINAFSLFHAMCSFFLALFPIWLQLNQDNALTHQLLQWRTFLQSICATGKSLVHSFCALARGPTASVPSSYSAAGCESVLCLAHEIVYFEFESVLGVQRVNKYLMTAPPLLSAQVQADDLLTFRHPRPDELLRTELSVMSAAPAPGGIEREGYLWSHLAQMSIARPPPAVWTLRVRGKSSAECERYG